MFKSDFSKKCFKGTPITVVTHKRKKTYENKFREGRVRGPDSGWLVKVSHGWEIVKEMRVAPSEVEAVKAKYGDGVFVDETPSTNF
jgi:hypothetical protein